ncbi:MAG: ferrochelatase [Acidiferrobacterales bacterium]|nr:ferrochelatase [Acidiferrobacterales bacterium]
MKNHIQNNYDHLTQPRIGVLLTNLGTPESADKSSVRRFLKEFLWDRRVVEVPRLIWWFVLNGVILNTRPKKAAAAYRKVWTEKGSPLMSISMDQLHALRSELAESNMLVEFSMRYGSPSISDGLERLRQQGAHKILVFPLYPQYSSTTTATTFDAVAAELKNWRWIPEMRFINQYHEHPGYITALANSVRKHWEQYGRADKLLLSFHGIPEAYFLQGDPYHCQCVKTGRLLAEALLLSESEWQISFQSRLGPKKWLQPYTDQTLEELGKSAVKSVQVICPGFSVDCLETIEEIAMENRDVFLEAGGERYEYIECLNSSLDHIEMMKQLVAEHTAGWNVTEEDRDLSQKRAIELGASS